MLPHRAPLPSRAQSQLPKLRPQKLLPLRPPHRQLLLTQLHLLHPQQAPAVLAPATTPSLRRRGWALAPQTFLVRVTTRSRVPRAWALARTPAAFRARRHLAPALRLLAEQVVRVAPVVPVALVVPVAQVQVSSVQAVPVVVSALAVPVVQVHPVVLVLQHVPDLVLTVHQQVAVAVVAVAPAVEPLVRSVVAAESPRHVSRSGQREQSSNSARHHRLVA